MNPVTKYLNSQHAVGTRWKPSEETQRCRRQPMAKPRMSHHIKPAQYHKHLKRRCV
ncbi:hypothetical protein Hanom_Chr16g01495251 [Helianthus anomalus]